MAVLRSFGTPHVNVQQRVGAIVIKHGHLEHVLRLVLKRLKTVSIDSPDYDDLMGNRKPSQLRARIKHALAASALGAIEQAEVLTLVEDSVNLSDVRNSLAHNTWMRKPNEPLMLVNDRKRTAEQVPSMAILKRCTEEIDRVRKRLNTLTKPLLAVD
jgi:hypothetical protein